MYDRSTSPCSGSVKTTLLYLEAAGRIWLEEEGEKELERLLEAS